MNRSYKWIPVIDEELCTGCSLCVTACGPKCLGIVSEVALLLCARTCGSEEHCIAVCPEDAIHMQWIPMKGVQDVGKWMAAERHAGARGYIELPVDDT